MRRGQKCFRRSYNEWDSPLQEGIIESVSSAQVVDPDLSQLDFPFWDSETPVDMIKAINPQNDSNAFILVAVPY